MLKENFVSQIECRIRLSKCASVSVSLVSIKSSELFLLVSVRQTIDEEIIISSYNEELLSVIFCCASIDLDILKESSVPEKSCKIGIKKSCDNDFFFSFNSHP